MSAAFTLAALLLAAGPATFTVTTTSDSGPGSLRTALTQCVLHGGHASIEFNVPKTDPRFDPRAGTWTIAYLDTPPALTVSDVTIDGTTQTQRYGDTNPAGPEIVLSGERHSVEYALVLANAARVTVRGLCIVEFLYGIEVYGAGAHHNRIVGNYIGVDPTGTKALGNYNGLELISGAHDNTVGGAAPGERNLVSGNQHVGIRLSDAHNNAVLGNYVGVDRTGSKAVGNYDGIDLEGRSRGNRIGGPRTGEGNLASGNVAYGVDLFGWGVQENVVQGNLIGTDAGGTQAVPNTYGVLFDDRSHDNLVGGLAPGEGNLISGNTAFGAYFYNNGTCRNIVRGNRIGTNLSGTAALPNETGVHIDGGTFENLVDRNLISGNLVAGITLFAINTDRNAITGNRIGTDQTGAKPLGNGADGVRIAFGPRGNVIGGSPTTANTIAHNGSHGVFIESPGDTANRISCNAIYQNRGRGIELAGKGLASPLIATARLVGDRCVISGTLGAPARGPITVEVFLGEANAQRLVQGKTYLGSVQADAGGRWTLATPLALPPACLAATATDGPGNTSAFATWLAPE